MGKKAKQLIPLTPEDRQEIVERVGTSQEPLTARQLIKSPVGGRKLSESQAGELLDEAVSCRELHAWPAKTAKGKPRYWNREPKSVARNAILAALRQAEEPLAPRTLPKKLDTPVKFSAADLEPLLEDLVAAGSLYRFPATTAKGQPRYWSRDHLAYARVAIRKLLEKKTDPQTESALRKATAFISDQQFRALLKEMSESHELWRHPPVGKSKTVKYGTARPRPEPYLKDVQTQLVQVVSKLSDAHVTHDELRRALVQLVESTGIPFGTRTTPPVETPAQTTTCHDELVALMRRIEPRADQGALVALRELRKAASLGKPAFDQSVLSLARQGRLSLHRHDYPASLSQQERDELVSDGTGTYYVGVALRQPGN